VRFGSPAAVSQGQQGPLTLGSHRRPHRPSNRGYVTVTPDHRCRVSRKLRDDFHNGEECMQLAGNELWIPPAATDRPNREFLEWHADTVFRG
jgi:hypothetical protein